MSIIDQALEKYNLKYEELNSTEKETLNVWLQAIQQGQLTLEKVKGYIASMKDAVEQELTKESKFLSFWTFLFNFRKDCALKARLRNYMLLEAFLSTPERAKEQLDRALASFASKVKV